MAKVRDSSIAADQPADFQPTERDVQDVRKLTSMLEGVDAVQGHCVDAPRRALELGSERCSLRFC